MRLVAVTTDADTENTDGVPDGCTCPAARLYRLGGDELVHTASCTLTISLLNQHAEDHMP